MPLLETIKFNDSNDIYTTLSKYTQPKDINDLDFLDNL